MALKFIILGICSIICGTVLFFTGLYFASEKFITKLNESTGELSENKRKVNVFKAKGSGYTTQVLGGITVLWGILVLCFPSIISILALIYMILLIVAFSVIYFAFK